MRCWHNPRRRNELRRRLMKARDKRRRAALAMLKHERFVAEEEKRSRAYARRRQIEHDLARELERRADNAYLTLLGVIIGFPALIGLAAFLRWYYGRP